MFIFDYIFFFYFVFVLIFIIVDDFSLKQIIFIKLYLYSTDYFTLLLCITAYSHNARVCESVMR
jgi:hypothetical protein